MNDNDKQRITRALREHAEDARLDACVATLLVIDPLRQYVLDEVLPQLDPDDPQRQQLVQLVFSESHKATLKHTLRDERNEHR